MSSILIEKGTVVTMGPLGVIDPRTIFIEGSRISAIGPNQEMARRFGDKTTPVIDATGKIVMPGLIDAHFHTCQQGLRGAFDKIRRLRLTRYPGWKWFLIPYEAALSKEEVLISAQAAYVNMVRVGTTCVSEHGGRHPEMLVQAMEEVGLHGLVAVSTMDMDTGSPELPENMLFTTKEAIERNLDIVQRWPFRGDQLARGVFSLRQIIACTPKLIETLVGLAEDNDTMVQTHAAEGYYEIYHALEKHNLRPTEYLASIGGLSPRVIAAHSVLLSEHEVELFAEHGVGVAHCPSGNFAGLGMANLPLMRRMGIKVGIGSDGAAGGSIDLFREMWVSLIGQTMHFGAPKMDRGTVSPLEILEIATIGGARVVGLQDEIGSLETGKRADLIILDASGLDAIPVSDPISTIVSCFSGHKTVETMIVNGQIVMENGKILTIDEKALQQEAAGRLKAVQDRFLGTFEG